MTENVFVVDEVGLAPGKGTWIMGKLVSGYLKKMMKAVVNGEEITICDVSAYLKDNLEMVEAGSEEAKSLLLSLMIANKDNFSRGQKIVFTE